MFYIILTIFQSYIYESIIYNFDNPIMRFYEFVLQNNNLELEDKMYNLGFAEEDYFYQMRLTSQSQYTDSNPRNAWKLLIQLDST